MSIDISVIWFVIIVFATLMYIVMDGFDLGIGMLFSVVHDGEERDVMVNSVAPSGMVTKPAGARRGRAVRRLSAGLCSDHRCAGYPADGDAHRPDFSRRGL